MYILYYHKMKHREVKASTRNMSDSAAMMATASSNGGSTVNPRSNGDRKPLYCTKCKTTNHTIDRCYFIIGFPPNKQLENKKRQDEGKFAGSTSHTDNAGSKDG